MLTKDELPACPVATTIRLIGNKWTIFILQRLRILSLYRVCLIDGSIQGLKDKIPTPQEWGRDFLMVCHC